MYFQHEFKHETQAVQDLAKICKDIMFQNMITSPITDKNGLIENLKKMGELINITMIFNEETHDQDFFLSGVCYLVEKVVEKLVSTLRQEEFFAIKSELGDPKWLKEQVQNCSYCRCTFKL